MRTRARPAYEGGPSQEKRRISPLHKRIAADSAAVRFSFVHNSAHK